MQRDLELIFFVLLSIVFVIYGALICVHLFIRVWKGGPYYSVKNKKGLPNYRQRVDVCNIPFEKTSGNQEPHI